MYNNIPTYMTSPSSKFKWCYAALNCSVKETYIILNMFFAIRRDTLSLNFATSYEKYVRIDIVLMRAKLYIKFTLTTKPRACSFSMVFSASTFFS